MLEGIGGTRRTATAATASLLAVALLAGCGSDKKKSEPAASPEKQAFITKTDAACKKVYKKTDAMTAQFRDQNPQPTPEKAAKFMKSIQPVAQQGVKDIRANKAPSGDSAQIQKINDAVDKGLTQVKQAGSDPNLAKGILAGGKNPFGDAQKLASDYGLHGCARDK